VAESGHQRHTRMPLHQVNYFPLTRFFLWLFFFLCSGWLFFCFLLHLYWMVSTTIFIPATAFCAFCSGQFIVVIAVFLSQAGDVVFACFAGTLLYSLLLFIVFLAIVLFFLLQVGCTQLQHFCCTGWFFNFHSFHSLLFLWQLWYRLVVVFLFPPLHKLCVVVLFVFAVAWQ